MGSKLITVLGITGTQGSSVATHFLKHSDWKIRGVTRNTESDKAKKWASKGVELVQADLDDVQSLQRAFKGTNAIYAVTDYYSNQSRVSGSDELKKKAKEAGRTVDEYAGDLEEGQGLNIAKAANDPEVLSTLEKFVFSTLTAIKKISGGKYKNAYEFDSKSNVETHIRENLPELNKRLSTLTMGIYKETWPDIPAFQPLKQSDGSYLFVDLKWPGPHVTHPEVIASKDTGAFVEALVLHHPVGTDVVGASEYISKADFASLWGRVMNQKTTTKFLDEKEWGSYIPEESRITILDMFKFFIEYGYAGGNPKVKTPAELGIKTTSMEEWIKGEDWSQVMK